MTQQEFFSLTGVQVENDEFWHIHEVYCDSELDKYEFCRRWCKMNSRRVFEAREQAKAQEQRQRDIDIAWRLLESWQRKRRARLDTWATDCLTHMTQRQEQSLNRLGIRTRMSDGKFAESRVMGYVYDDIVATLHNA